MSGFRTVFIYSNVYVYNLDGDSYTEAQCEAMVMCNNNHWIITPNLTRSILIDLWPGGLKSNFITTASHWASV